MYLIYRYNFTPADDCVEEKLKNLEIKYNKFSNPSGRISLTFELHDNILKEKELIITLPQEHIFGDGYYVMVFKRKIFEAEELMAAEWLMIRTGEGCPWLGINEDFDNLSYEEQCPIIWKNKEYPRHIVQTKPIILSKEPCLKKKITFYSGGYCAKEFLCDVRLVELFRNSGLNGFAFQNVLIGKSRKPSEKVYQLVATQELAESTIGIDDRQAESRCDCGKVLLAYYTSKHSLIIREEIDRTIDFWQTPPMFGDCPQNQTQDKPPRFVTWEKAAFGTRGMIVSQKAYQFLLAHKLTRNLVVIPLEKQ